MGTIPFNGLTKDFTDEDRRIVEETKQVLFMEYDLPQLREDQNLTQKRSSRDHGDTASRYFQTRAERGDYGNMGTALLSELTQDFSNELKAKLRGHFY